MAVVEIGNVESRKNSVFKHGIFPAINIVICKLGWAMKQYSVVKITKLQKEFGFDEKDIGSRIPKVGDIATIIDVYDKAYDLECCDKNGVTLWLKLFEVQDAELELVCI